MHFYAFSLDDQQMAVSAHKIYPTFLLFIFCPQYTLYMASFANQYFLMQTKLCKMKEKSTFASCTVFQPFVLESCLLIVLSFKIKNSLNTNTSSRLPFLFLKVVSLSSLL